MTGNVELWFPTAIYDNVYEFTDGEQETLISKIENLSRMIPSGGKNWYSKILNSHGTYNLMTDPDFSKLNSWIESSINEFAQELRCKDKFALGNGWYNIYGKGDFQEMHFHSKSMFSCSFFLKAPPGSAPLIFESPLMPDMLPPDYLGDTHLTYGHAEYQAVPGRLVVFRSYLRHIVPPHGLEDTRISLAYNIK
jgi:uncharacterized protein (TIGR02466 family)